MPRAVAGEAFRALALLACIVCPLLAFLAVNWEVAPGPWRLALAAPHAAIYVFLLGWFGRSLARGREALITGVARRVHGTLTPEIEAYTRRVTLAWCGFFVFQLVASWWLFAFAPFEAWAVFANVLNLPLVALMFAGEYGYRALRYPDHPRASMARALRAFVGEGAAVPGAKAR